MDWNRELGIKSYCFRKFKDAKIVAKMIRDCGVDRVDLSACHVDYNDPAAQRHVIDTFREAGVVIVGVGVVGLSGDAISDRRYFEFCKLAGGDTVSVTFEPVNHQGILHTAADLCREFGFKCAIHNHGGAHWLGNSQILKYLLAQTPPSIGVCIDTAWADEAGEDALKWVQTFAGRIHATHLKDFSYDKSGKPEDVVIGTGTLNLPAYIDALDQVRFGGSAVIEYEGDADNPVPALKRCVDEMRKLPQLVQRPSDAH